MRGRAFIQAKWREASWDGGVSLVVQMEEEGYVIATHDVFVFLLDFCPKHVNEGFCYTGHKVLLQSRKVPCSR